MLLMRKLHTPMVLHFSEYKVGVNNIDKIMLGGNKPRNEAKTNMMDKNIVMCFKWIKRMTLGKLFNLVFDILRYLD